MFFQDLSEAIVWNYDPISRGLKLIWKIFTPPEGEELFGTMTRFLGD